MVCNTNAPKEVCRNSDDAFLNSRSRISYTASFSICPDFDKHARKTAQSFAFAALARADESRAIGAYTGLCKACSIEPWMHEGLAHNCTSNLGRICATWNMFYINKRNEPSVK
jgi:hypothetical protein